MKSSPYINRPATSFWKSGVAKSTTACPSGLYKKKWPIDKSTRIATAGSCFAQHIGRFLRSHGFNVMDVEPPPQGLELSDQEEFGYSIYSARYGNIYTVKQLLQLAQEAYGEFTPGEVSWIGKRERCFDALRPGVEPEGLGSRDEVFAHRQRHLEEVRKLFSTMELFVFTFGLTESWLHSSSGTAYPTAPGTIAGSYDPNVYEFRNFYFDEVKSDFEAFRALVHLNQARPCRFLVTVSPVPLAATASESHVLQATVYSKSVLRAVAGELAMTHHDVDYFPSYEIITNPWSPDMFYSDDLRSVTKGGVATVMSVFLAAHGDGAISSEVFTSTSAGGSGTPRGIAEDVICEEAILAAFGEEAP